MSDLAGIPIQVRVPEAIVAEMRRNPSATNRNMWIYYDEFGPDLIGQIRAEFGCEWEDRLSPD